MLGIGAVVNIAAFLAGEQVACFTQVVEFVADRVSGLAKFLGHFPQIGCCLAVREELEQHFEAGFGCDDGVQHRVNVCKMG